MVLINALSSIIFLTNCSVAYMKEQFIYLIISFGLFLSSVIFHLNDTNYYLFMVDKVMVYSIIVYGGYYMWKKRGINAQNIDLHIVGCLCAIICLFLYTYGYYTQTWCYHPEFGYSYHSIMHGFSSLGHHCIQQL
jgi:hypothetical protein